ncbi:MAG: dihydropteroate synthase, partial [Planctomycetota bacterium]|nr:dihydropteroate synthase [Planctomycetota bacterium]
MLHLRLNARILTEARAAPVLAEVRRAGGTAQEAEALAGAGPPGAFPPDGLALALENLSAEEADRLNRLMASAGGTTTILPKTGGADGEAELILAGARRHFAALVTRLEQAPADGPALGGEVARAVENHARRRFRIRLGARTLAVGPRPAIMGVLNVTPDSFSDGGRYLDPTDAVAQAERLVQEGADLVDVGGESTRPGSDPVPEDEELARVMPVVETLASCLDVPISIDTRRARVAREAASAGAGLINDVTGLLGDPEMPAAVAETGAGCVIMHMLGKPKTMQHRPRYDNLMADIARHLRRGMQAARDAGVPEEAIIVDPGIGFGKTLAHNLEVLARLGQLRTLGVPILVGPSRKRFIGEVAGVEAP